MSKTIKAKSHLGINTIMDSVMVPDGFSRVCDGLDVRSGVARPWQLPSHYRSLTSSSTMCIWEYRNKWYESSLYRTYHGEYLYGQEAVYFTEEGANHLPPQKIIDGVQVRLGSMRPLAQPLVAAIDTRYPATATATISGSGGVQPGAASYRIAAIKNNAILTPGSPIKIQVVTASSIRLDWRGVSGADGYAIFGRTSGSERLLIKLANTTTWTDDGSTSEGYDAASNYDSSKSYQYVYTYYRKVGAVEDESGPSPLSVASDASKIPSISRVPTSDGFYSEDTITYVTSTNTLTATKPAGVDKLLSQALARPGGTATVLTMATAHGLVNGNKGYITGTVSPTTVATTEYEVTVPAQLSDPTASITGYPTGGTVSVGAHTYKLMAVRGDTSATYGNPAQTVGLTLAATVPTGSGSVTIAISGYSSGTDAFIAYRDGSPVAIIPITVATWTDTGFSAIPGISAPATNETATRCVVVNNVSVSLTGATGYFNQSLCNIALTGATSFVPLVGDVLYISSLIKIPELNGTCTVTAYSGGVATVNKRLLVASGTTDSSGGSIAWRSGNGYYAGWRIYRVGDTAQFLLVADLDLGTLSFTDTVGTDALGIAIPTAYTENGLEVVFDRAPYDAKRMVVHLGMRFAIVDDVVRWTPSGMPDAWPDVYSATFQSKPVALASYRGILSVICEDGLYALIGNTPSTLSPGGPYSNLGCVAPFSVQSSNRGLMWLSKTGLVISTNGFMAECLTSEKISGRYFYAPSTAGVYNNQSVGYGWWLPSTQTVQFAESMREEQIDKSMYPVSQVSSDLPIPELMADIRSFYWDNRYAIYFVGTSEHARSGCIMVDMASEGMPVETLPIKITDAHVSLGGDLFMLLYQRPTVTVSITSPV